MLQCFSIHQTKTTQVSAMLVNEAAPDADSKPVGGEVATAADASMPAVDDSVAAAESRPA